MSMQHLYCARSVSIFLFHPFFMQDDSIVTSILYKVVLNSKYVAIRIPILLSSTYAVTLT